MDDLEADWKAVRRPRRSKNKVKSPDLHEDWIAVRGSTHPPFAWIVNWKNSDRLLIWRMIIVGKRRTHEGTFYQTRYQALIFKTPGVTLFKGECPESTHYSRSELCFSREEVVRAIQNARMEHLFRAAREMRRLNDLIALYSVQMKSFENYLVEVQREPVPDKVLKRISSKSSKRLVVP